MIITPSSPSEREPRRFARGKSNGERMKRFFLGGILTAATLAGGLAFTSEVFATQPTPPSQCEVPDAAASLDEAESLETPPVDCTPEHKVWVCHATAGMGALKNGYDLIEVDIASTNGPDHLAHATTNPKNNGIFGILPDKIDVGPNSDCGGVPSQPADKVTYSDWVDGEYGCDATTVEQTRIVTKTPYTLVDKVWTLDEGNASSKTETQKRDLTKGEQKSCPVRAIPTDPGTKPPSCDAAGSVLLPVETVGYEWVKQGDGTYVAVADEGYFFEDDAVTTFTPSDLTQVKTGCDTTTTVADPPKIEVASNAPIFPPAAAAPVPAAVVSATPTQLPSTGSSSWALALTALVTLLGGTGLVRLSRRPAD